MPPEQMAKFWEDFINGHIPNFRKAPIDQIDNYVRECWEAIVDSAKWAEKDLPGVLDRIRPDVVCIDNVILFPAIKRFGKPWVRIISCSENEIEDDAIPPHLSGCGERMIGPDTGRFASASARSSSRFTTTTSTSFSRDAARTRTRSAGSSRRHHHLNLLLYPEPGQVCARHAARPRAVPVPGRMRAQGGALRGAQVRRE